MQEFVSDLNTRSAYHIFKTLRGALNHAVRMDLIIANPCDRIAAPKQSKSKPTLWTVEETLRFLAECRRTAPGHYPLFFTEIATGLRLGEVLALRWRDVDGDVLRVTRALDRPQGGGFTFADPKSPRSTRTVRLPQEVVGELRLLRRRHVEERLRRGPCAKNGVCRDQHCPLWHEHELVFAQENGKPVHAHNLTQRTMQKLMGRAKVPQIRFHDLRHAHGTLLAAAQVSLKTISERLGHSSEAFTVARYLHVTDQQQSAVDAVSRVLSLSNQNGPAENVPPVGGMA